MMTSPRNPSPDRPIARAPFTPLVMDTTTREATAFHQTLICRRQSRLLAPSTQTRGLHKSDRLISYNGGIADGSGASMPAVISR